MENALYATKENWTYFSFKIAIYWASTSVSLTFEKCFSITPSISVRVPGPSERILSTTLEVSFLIFFFRGTAL